MIARRLRWLLRLQSGSRRPDTATLPQSSVSIPRPQPAGASSAATGFGLLVAESHQVPVFVAESLCRLTTVVVERDQGVAAATRGLTEHDPTVSIQELPKIGGWTIGSHHLSSPPSRDRRYRIDREPSHHLRLRLTLDRPGLDDDVAHEGLERRSSHGQVREQDVTETIEFRKHVLDLHPRDRRALVAAAFGNQIRPQCLQLRSMSAIFRMTDLMASSPSMSSRLRLTLAT